MLRIVSQRSVPTLRAVRCVASGGAKVDGNQTRSDEERMYGNQKNVMQGIQSRDVEFTSSSSRTVLADAIEHASMSSTERRDNVRQGIQDTPTQQYDRTGNVSLYSCMQSTVPHPYQSGSPTHLNMPGGGQQLQSKYISNKLQDNLHPKGSRSFHTCSILCAAHPTGMAVEEPCPQGVQGDECVRYQLWRNNCVRFQLSNCDEQLESFKSGRKTLAAIFEDQDRVIRDIVHQQHTEEMSSQSATFSDPPDHDESSIQSSHYPDLHGHSVQSLLDEAQPCPQGVQGLQCVQFKEWLHNCNRYGLSDCENQLREVAGGRRTLAQIIQEQEEQIEAIATQYRSQQQTPAERD